MMRSIFFLCCLGLLATMNAAANGARPLVLNEVVPLNAASGSRFPLYLSRTGTYFAELYLEADAGHSFTTENELKLNIEFRRDDETLFQRELDVNFRPGKSVATLFHLDTPFDLPQRKALDVHVRLSSVDGALVNASPTVRLQLTRKTQFLPFLR